MLFVGGFLTIYFLGCTLFGDKGVVEYFVLRRKMATKLTTATELQNKLQEKQNLVHKIGVESLDLDLLDEQTRRNLGYAGPNEIVIYDREKPGDKLDNK